MNDKNIEKTNVSFLNESSSDYDSDFEILDRVKKSPSSSSFDSKKLPRALAKLQDELGSGKKDAAPSTIGSNKSETRGRGQREKKKSTNIYKVKRNISIDELCVDLPNEFNEYIKYVRLLKFKEKPDYKYLQNLFVNLLSKNKHTIDNIYDWNLEAIKIKNLIKKDEK